MNRRTMLALSSATVIACTPLHAQTLEEEAIPPENAMKVSEIVAKIEARPDFRYLDEVDWDGDGYYQITYFTNDKAKVEMRINPVTGEPI
ncbi:PepSY domain-containing protein [Chelativorans sp. AA-79]|uniref:PepSY domain-containing protein n=1 Tax=Chelativorans sp. AA-79 TaxID=3028735 RepID=UPI0023F97779|nr:PepSY domain-containing protein [Chelativorans sp. AA-79]WEX10025.1 PepSY domain-containing protein [Chelativorans sp. AA-79]